MDKKLVVVFASAVFPNQFTLLCDHLNEKGLAEAYCFTTPGNVKKWSGQHKNLLPFQPDGPIVGSQSYYYSAKLERSARISRGLALAIQKFQSHKPVDLIVAHVLWGCPYFLFDTLSIPVVSYIEFPSYRLHGWAPEFPPDASQKMGDANMEMISMYCLQRSAAVIVPSLFAKGLLPEVFHYKVHVQLEGFKIPTVPNAEFQNRKAVNHFFTIGFAARDLSSSKGFDRFMAIAHSIEERGLPIRCVAIGSDRVSTYGFETQWVERHFGSKDKGFYDYLLEQYPKAKVERLGLLGYKEYQTQLHTIDLFVYPLRFGVANWGLIELLIRGRPVLASNTCFIPEVIQSGINGLLMPKDAKVDDWVDRIQDLMHSPELLNALSRGASERVSRFSIEHVAPHYCDIFSDVVGNGQR